MLPFTRLIDDGGTIVTETAAIGDSLSSSWKLELPNRCTIDKLAALAVIVACTCTDTSAGRRGTPLKRTSLLLRALKLRDAPVVAEDAPCTTICALVEPCVIVTGLLVRRRMPPAALTLNETSALAASLSSTAIVLVAGAIGRTSEDRDTVAVPVKQEEMRVKESQQRSTHQELSQ